MMKAEPAAAFEMIQPELVLEFLRVAFDAPPQLREPDEVRDRDRLGQGREPVRGRLGGAGRPLDQQPFFGPGRRAALIAMGRPDAYPGEARAHGPASAFAPGHAVPRRGQQLRGEPTEADRLLLRRASDADG